MQYLLESAFCLALLYTFYHVVLRRETFFQINRAYLLLAPLVALIVPALNLRLEKPAPPEVVSAIPETAAQPATTNDAWVALVENMSAAPAGVEQVWEKPLFNLTLGEVAWWMYLLVASVLVFRLLVQLARMLIFLRRCRLEKSGDVVLATGPKNTPLASFFGFVFWHPGSDNNDEQHLMFEHEMVHVRQWHSLDILFIELLIALQWFNPFLYIYRRSLREVHEYIADEQVVLKTGSAYTYAKLLAHRFVSRPAIEVQPILVNTFHSELKKRLTMLAQQPSHPARRAKLLLVLPVFALLMTLFAFRLVEEIPAANKLMETVSSYQNELSEVVVASEKPVVNEPTPYIFYWGTIQVRLERDPATGRCFGELETTPELFREAIKREPRLWNGKILEQHLEFKLDGITVRSDYNDEDVYYAAKTQLQIAFSELTKEPWLELQNVSVPGSPKTTIRLVFGGETPSWVALSDGPQTIWSASNAADFFEGVSEVLWSERNMMKKMYITENTFWKLMQNPPELVLKDGQTQTVEDYLAILASSPSGGLISVVPSENAALNWEELQYKIDSLRPQLIAGAKLAIYNNKLNENGKTGFPKNTLLAVELVPENDPRLFVERNNRQYFKLIWGDFSRSFVNMNAVSYWNGMDATDRRYSDNLSLSTPWFMSKKAFLRMLRTKPQLFQEKDVMEDMNMTLEHKGYSFVVKNDPPDAALIEKLEKSVQPGDIINLTGIQGERNKYRQVVFPKSMLKELDDMQITGGYSQIDVSADNGPIRILILKADAEVLESKWKGRKDVWFQYGDVDLTRGSLTIEIREDDTKKPLKSYSENQLASQMKISASPNPAHNVTTVKIHAPVTGTSVITLTDAAGRVVFTQTVDYTHAGEHQAVQLDLTNVKPTGLYYVTWTLEGVRAVCSLVVE